MPIQARHAAGIPSGALYRATDKNGAHGHQAATRGSGRRGGSYSGGTICRYAVTGPLARPYGLLCFGSMFTLWNDKSPLAGACGPIMDTLPPGPGAAGDPCLFCRILSNIAESGKNRRNFDKKSEKIPGDRLGSPGNSR